MTGATFIAAAQGPRVARFRRRFRPLSVSRIMESMASLHKAIAEAQREREELLRRIN